MLSCRNFLKTYATQLKFVGLALTKANSFECVTSNKSSMIVRLPIVNLLNEKSTNE